MDNSRFARRPNGALRILHIVLSIGETNAAYNQFCLPFAEERAITICTYFKANIRPPDRIALFEGDNSLTGFLRSLKAALNANEYDIIQAHSPHVAFLGLVLMLFMPRKRSSTTIAIVHDSYHNYKFRNRLLWIPVFAMFKKVVCCGRASFQSFPSLYRWLVKDRLSFVPNGLDIARIDRVRGNAKPERSRAKDFSIVVVSRLVDIKNLFLVLAAFEQSVTQHSRLLLIGEGPLRESLNALIKRMGLESQITLVGLLPRDMVFQHLLSADLMISASKGEGLPVAVLEGMASRCPVLLSDIPPHREIAEGAPFIPLIPPDDTSGFAREITKFREMSASQRALIGEQCRNLVEARFSLRAMHAGYLEIYSQLVGRQLSS